MRSRQGFGKRGAIIVAIVGTFAGALLTTSRSSAGYGVTVTPETVYTSSWEGWGTSLAWWANALGGKADVDQYADYVFGSTGLGFNIARYNIGGGYSNQPAGKEPSDWWKDKEEPIRSRRSRTPRCGG